tara:strand:- start:317 stop:688 length:372 start_codon:yes stop_codon:yes gene_type:complete
MKASKKKMIDTIRKSKGIVVSICKNLDMTRSAFYKRLESDQELRYELELARDELCDFSETKLWEHIKDGNLQAVMFVLRTLGRHRGYIEKQEVEQTSTQVNVIEVPAMDAFEPQIDEIKEDQH